MAGFSPRAYWEERLERNEGLRGVGHIVLGLPFNRWMYRVRRNVFNRTVRRRLDGFPPGAVLDVGSGTGFYLDRWQELGARRIVGSDITDTAVERLRVSHPGIDTFRMDICDGDPRLDGSFDAVSCMDVLFHVLDDARFAAALQNLRKALRQGGVLFLSDNFPKQPVPRERHFATRCLDEYTEALHAARFSIETRVPIFHLMNQPFGSSSRSLHRWWTLVERACKRLPAAGGPLGAAVYPIESAIVRMRREGVSTQIMVCRALP